MKRSKVFIASSVRNLDWARECVRELEHDVDCTIWYQGVFNPGHFAIEALTSTLGQYDFGIFLCMPEDVVVKKGGATKQVRDNVIFELGLYLGRLGIERCFVVAPRGVRDSLPSDLVGVIPAEIECEIGDDAHQSKMTSACHFIRRKIKDLGPIRNDYVKSATLGHLAVAVGMLQKQLNAESFMGFGVAERFAIAYRTAHENAQTIVDKEWKDVVLSLKTPHEDQVRLNCHYLESRIDPRKLEPGSLEPSPSTIPIASSIAGQAYLKRKMILVSNTDVLNCVDKRKRTGGLQVDEDVLESIRSGSIGSIVASPVFCNGEVVAVAKLDSTTKGLFHESDERLSAVMRAVVACFEMAYKVSLIADDPLRGGSKSGRSTKKSKK